LAVTNSAVWTVGASAKISDLVLTGTYDTCDFGLESSNSTTFIDNYGTLDFLDPSDHGSIHCRMPIKNETGSSMVMETNAQVIITYSNTNTYGWNVYSTGSGTTVKMYTATTGNHTALNVADHGAYFTTYAQLNVYNGGQADIYDGTNANAKEVRFSGQSTLEMNPDNSGKTLANCKFATLTINHDLYIDNSYVGEWVGANRTTLSNNLIAVTGDTKFDTGVGGNGLLISIAMDQTIASNTSWNPVMQSGGSYTGDWSYVSCGFDLLSWSDSIGIHNMTLTAV
jgi:hypothetical protein